MHTCGGRNVFLRHGAAEGLQNIPQDRRASPTMNESREGHVEICSPRIDSFETPPSIQPL